MRSRRSQGVPVKDDDIAARAPSPHSQRDDGGALRVPAEAARASTRPPGARTAEETRSGVRNRGAGGTTIELDVGPHYALHTLMGETAYGQAYRASQLEGRREDVALHVLPIEDERDARDLPLAFAKCAQLSHPHVIGLKAYGRAQPDGPYYLVTQALEGASLAALLDDEGTFDLLRALRLVRQIAQALRAAHTLHIMHGALSPANVRLVSGERSEDVRVVGFGCAAFRAPLSAPTTTSAGRISRPPRPYEAPELVSGAQPDVRTDVFALGSLLFRMLTGQVPVLRDGEPPPALLACAVQPVPPELDALVAGCLARDPDARIGDTVVLIGKLREIEDAERGIDARDGISGESLLPPEREGQPDQVPTSVEAGRDDADDHATDDPDDHSMMGGNRTSMVWIAAGLLLALFALWLLWEANTRS